MLLLFEKSNSKPELRRHVSVDPAEVVAVADATLLIHDQPPKRIARIALKTRKYAFVLGEVDKITAQINAVLSEAPRAARRSSWAQDWGSLPFVQPSAPVDNTPRADFKEGDYVRIKGNSFVGKIKSFSESDSRSCSVEFGSNTVSCDESILELAPPEERPHNAQGDWNPPH